MRELSSRSRWAVIAALLVPAALMVGCNKKSAKSTSPSASASASAGSVLANVPAACGEYATKLCAKAGNESPTCQAVKTSTELMPEAACTAAVKNIDYSLKKIGEKGKACDELVSKLCKEFGEKTEICTMVTTQTKNFPPERCTTMLGQLPQIIAELKQMDQANKPLSPEQQALITAGQVPAFGPATAKVTVVEFSDFQCPYCSKAADVATQIKQKYGDKVRFVFRQFPLSFHKDAHDAAEASLAAHAEGKFWQYHDKLFQNQQKLDRASLEGYAKEMGLNMANFKKALDTDQYSAQVDADMKLGEQVAVQGTPTMFVNGARVQNPTSFDVVSGMIETALKGAGPTG